MATLCAEPEIGAIPRARPAEKRRKVQQNPLNNLPRELRDDCPPLEWWRDHGCFSFVVDCQPLAQVICGHIPLKAMEMAPIFERMKTADLESKTLAELRDTLLPKLISGELRIPDAEKFLEEAGI